VCVCQIVRTFERDRSIKRHRSAKRIEGRNSKLSIFNIKELETCIDGESVPSLQNTDADGSYQ